MDCSWFKPTLHLLETARWGWRRTPNYSDSFHFKYSWPHVLSAACSFGWFAPPFSFNWEKPSLGSWWWLLFYLKQKKSNKTSRKENFILSYQQIYKPGRAVLVEWWEQKPTFQGLKCEWVRRRQIVTLFQMWPWNTVSVNGFLPSNTFSG